MDIKGSLLSKMNLGFQRDGVLLIPSHENHQKHLIAMLEL